MLRSFIILILTLSFFSAPGCSEKKKYYHYCRILDGASLIAVGPTIDFRAPDDGICYYMLNGRFAKSISVNKGDQFVIRISDVDVKLAIETLKIDTKEMIDARLLFKPQSKTSQTTTPAN